jgi:hypothetical protein
MSPPKNLYWDSCVFIRYLTRKPADHMLSHIDQYVADARDGKFAIHCSTIVFSEIRPSFLKQRGYGKIQDFFSDLGAAIVPCDPNPNIMIWAGALRDHTPVNPGNPKIDEEHQRSIGTPDAIHLSTCLFLRDVSQLHDIVFHTFDKGKGKNWEGRCVPLLGFERWYPPDRRIKEIAEVCGLTRTEPHHPTPDLVTGASRSGPP